jgi:5-(carboxyamino)imidazole ribonucleotide synthase
MYNILGSRDFSGKYRISETKIKNMYIKMYGKSESKPQRKLGHLNLVDENDMLGVEGLLESLASIKNQIKLMPV